MSRKLTALLISSALVFGSLGSNAWAVSAPAAAAGPAAANNQAPLPPAGAAGIKQAQAFEDTPWLGIGIVLGLFVAGVILLDDDDDDGGSTSTTAP